MASFSRSSTGMGPGVRWSVVVFEGRIPIGNDRFFSGSKPNPLSFSIEKCIVRWIPIGFVSFHPFSLSLPFEREREREVVWMVEKIKNLQHETFFGARRVARVADPRNMPTSKRVVAARSQKYHENIHRRGFVPELSSVRDFSRLIRVRSQGWNDTC